jgi:hypothetical protein
MLSAIKAIEAVEAYLLAQQFFAYYTVNDGAVCEKCDRYNDSSMTRREIRRMFPYLIEYTDMFWVPMVHPNCRCILILEETDEDLTVLKARRKLSTDELIAKIQKEKLRRSKDNAVHDPLIEEILATLHRRKLKEKKQ